MVNLNDRIIIGTAQFANNYGLSKIKNNLEEKHDLLNKIMNYKCHGIDTAIQYGQAQENIGSWILKNNIYPKIYTKIPGIGSKNDMENIFKKCLNQLKINKVEGLLIHNQNTWGNNNTKLFAEKLIKSKKINHIGVSIYDQKFIPEDSLASIIQVPGNIFNYKLLTSKKLERFINKGGEVHVRSVFIQGLLLMSPHKIPDYFAKLIKPLKEFHNLCKKNDVNPITLSTGCIFKLIPQCKLVIGIDSIKQLDKIINKTKIQVSDNIVNEALKIGKQYSSNLWDPRNWS